jgi:hypothetical protein
MLRRRLAAVALAALTATLLILPGMAAGAQTGDQALVRVAHFAPGLLIGGGLAAAAGFVVQQRRSSG